MSTPPVIVRSSLFHLLPALYRLRDAQLASSASTKMGPLESLLSVVDEQMAILEENIAQLYDDQFIETCAPWVVPYIGELIGYQSIHGIASAVDSPRAEVGSTIGFRRRKGTVPVFEQLARDATGWGAHAVEFFQILATTQWIRNHVRPHNYYAPNLRGWQSRAFMDSGFDRTAHKVDVRRIGSGRGRYNVQNIGIFLWSLPAWPLTEVPLSPIAASPQCFRFHPLGIDMPLFHPATELPPETTTLAAPANVPDRLSRHELCHDIRRIVEEGAQPVYYGPGLSLALLTNGSLESPGQIQVTDLSGTDGSWINLPTGSSGNILAVDPHLGRVAIPPGATGSAAPSITASCFYGFNAPIGGGEYPRLASFSASSEQAVVRVPGDFATVHDALAALAGDGVVEVTNSAIYSEPSGLAINVRANGHIELRGADGARPTLLLGGAITVTGGTEADFDLNGFLVSYSGTGSPPAALVHVPNSAGNVLTELGITHSTLVPGWALDSTGKPNAAYAGLPTVLVEVSGTTLRIKQSIVGTLWLNNQSTASLEDSILDATDQSSIAIVESIDSATQKPKASGALTLNGATVIGKIYTSLLTLASDSIFLAELTQADIAGSPPPWSAPLWAARRQQGCVRYSYVPAGSILPRQFNCVGLAPHDPAPMFFSLRYGNPTYAKLVPTTDPAIRQGADDSGEMGAFHFLLAPLREADLRVRLAEYIPVGLEFGIFYQS